MIPAVGSTSVAAGPPRVFRALFVDAASVAAAAAVATAILLTMTPAVPTRTYLLATGVMGLGAWLIGRAAAALGDPAVRRLTVVFLAKVVVVLVLLKVGWLRGLYEPGAAGGYDPQRYYFAASGLVDGGFDPAAARGSNLNFVGILYYYAVIFAACGRHPAAAALVNAFVTLLATLVLLRVGYRVKPLREPSDWTLGLAMALPEVVWFDVLTARETLCMALFTIASLGLCARFARGGKAVLRVGPGALVGLLVVVALMGSVRPPLVVAAVGVSVVTMFLLRRGGLGSAALWAAGAAAVAIVVPVVTERLGGSPFHWSYMGRVLGDQGDYALATFDWEPGSVGRLLVARNAFEAVALLAPRAILSLILPFPGILLSVEGLADGSWATWQWLLTASSALVYVATVPLVFAAVLDASTSRPARSRYILIAPALMALAAVAGGSAVLQERYRVLAALLLWGCVWLGRGSSRRVLAASYAAWWTCLAAGWLAYVFLKSGWSG